MRDSGKVTCHPWSPTLCGKSNTIRLWTLTAIRTAQVWTVVDELIVRLEKLVRIGCKFVGGFERGMRVCLMLQLSNDVRMYSNSEEANYVM